jgi:hypothetical protein
MLASREVTVWCCGLRERVTAIETGATDISEAMDSRVVGHDDSKRMRSKFRKAAGIRVRTNQCRSIERKFFKALYNPLSREPQVLLTSPPDSIMITAY